MLFVAEPDAESAVRQRIDLALSGGQQQGPDGVISRWRLDASQRSDVTAEEADQAERLTRT